MMPMKDNKRHGSCLNWMRTLMWTTPLLVVPMAIAQPEIEKPEVKTHPYDIQLSEWLVTPEELGPGWTKPEGVIIDSFAEVLAHRAFHELAEHVEDVAPEALTEERVDAAVVDHLALAVEHVVVLVG